MPRYLLHGLCVEAETPLHAVLDSASMGTAARVPDVRITPWQVDSARFADLVERIESAPRLIDRTFPVAPGKPALRAISSEHGRRWLSLFFDRALFQLDRDTGELQRIVASSDDVAFGEVLQAGSYWATLCTLRGRTALHASAIDLPVLGGTMLIAARSGQGKSSTAAALALAGARLRSDDVVTLIPTKQGFSCESGSLALRMRKPIASPLSDTLSAHHLDSGDDRHLYIATADIPATSPVVAILFPQLEDTDIETSVVPISALEGFRLLAQEPRVGGVRDRAHLAARVAELTALCGSVPLRRARFSIVQRDLARQGHALMQLLRADPEMSRR